MITIKKLWLCSLYLAPLILLLTLCNGCDREGEYIPTNAPTAVRYVQEGWLKYQEGDFAAAVDSFTAALNRDALDSTAYLGLGWSYAKIFQYDESLSNFELLLSIITDQSMRTDAYVGMAMTYAAQKNDSLAILTARIALSMSDNYQFQYDPRITTQMLHVVIAQIYFNRENYLDALMEIDTNLEPGYINTLAGEGIIKSENDKLFKATTFSYTPGNGIAELKITKSVIVGSDTTEIDAELVNVESIANTNLGVEYEVLNFEQGGGTIRFFGLPIPQSGQEFLVDYQYASDFGIYLARLGKIIQDLKD